MSGIELKDFFGFARVEVVCDNRVLKPTLPVKHKDKTIYPYGEWTGVYFSEELKAHEKLGGYKFKLLEGYSFTKAELFYYYVNCFYELKKILQVLKDT